MSLLHFWDLYRVLCAHGKQRGWQLMLNSPKVSGVGSTPWSPRPPVVCRRHQQALCPLPLCEKNMFVKTSKERYFFAIFYDKGFYMLCISLLHTCELICMRCHPVYHRYKTYLAFKEVQIVWLWLITFRDRSLFFHNVWDETRGCKWWVCPLPPQLKSIARIRHNLF